MGPCIAQSINFKLPGDKLISTAQRQCSECGVRHFGTRSKIPVVSPPTLPEAPETALPNNTNSQKSLKRKAPEPLGTSRTTRACKKASQRLAKLQKIIRAGAPEYEIPENLSPEQLDVLKMAAAILSPLAIEQFTSLVRQWRDRNEHVIISGNTEDLLEQQGRYLKAADEKSTFSKFRLRYARASVAREADKDKAERGQMRLSTAKTKALAQKLDMTSEAVHRHLEEGRIWNANLFDIHVKDWKALKGGQQEALHGLLDRAYTKNLCRAGKIFQEIISKGSRLVFRWEKEDFNLAAKDGSLLWETVERAAD
ncbi:hypothetical protein QQZ08_010846 [Neonectria magnoliae]|uniref:Uncharacterized protein n=1 Tax=Neonectria magnoliae TaxID=2732573 RepID=A0ABR1HG11_9HYPO